MIRIYTDGSARGNPGPGGYAAILIYQGKSIELTGGYRHTTNNRMELLAVITGLEALKKDNIPITVYVDSKYVIDAIENKWLWAWQKKQFKGKFNADLWKRYLPLHDRFSPKYVWIKGHAGYAENERCDKLAVAASKKPNLPPDEEYEMRSKSTYDDDLFQRV